MARWGDRELARAESWQRGIEDELAKERADELGRAGRRLDEALRAYRNAIDAHEVAVSPEQVESLLDAIATRVYALLVQRESTGLVVDNLAHVRAAYEIPDAAVKRLGVSSRTATKSIS